MKRIVFFIVFITLLTLCAPAQTTVDFREMPLASIPSPMPDHYPAGVYWDRFFYVTPGAYSDAGPGFKIDPAMQHNSVAFVGGPLCTLTVPCYGMIKMIAPQANPAVHTFQPMTIKLSSGWLDNTVEVTGYNNGRYVGTVVWKLSTEPYMFSFPATWKVTQLVFTPKVLVPSAVNPIAGSMVVYKFTFDMQ